MRAAAVLHPHDTAIRNMVWAFAETRGLPVAQECLPCRCSEEPKASCQETLVSENNICDVVLI